MIATALLMLAAWQDGAVASFKPMPWITVEDYPRRALEAGEEGRVVFLVDLDDSGRAETCEILRSSGSQLLDDTTCSLLKRRAQFPDRLEDGVNARFRIGYYNWKLPPAQP
jgi:TonB family protein